MSSDSWHPLGPRPLTYLTFWINQQLGGRNPAGYHAVDLALHLIAVVLVFRVLSALIPQSAALVSAAIFSVHPFVAEPVNYIFERSTLLETIFCLAALLTWTRQRHWLATLWFAAALLSKEECVAFPLVLVLLHLADGRDRREIKAIGVMLALALAAGVRVFAIGAAVHGSGVGTQAGVSLRDYLLTQGTVILRYFRMLLLPWGFTIDPGIPIATGALAYLDWAVVVLLALLATRRLAGRREGFWFCSGLLLLLPSSSIFPAADLAADRRMYLPLVAFCAVAGLAIAGIPYRVAPVLLVAALTALSFERTQTWRSETSLWTDAVAKAPGKVRPKIQLARAVGGADGLAVLEQAKSIAPEDPKIASEEGRIAISMSNPQQALVYFGRALALDPANPAAINNRGLALLMLGQQSAARADFERALALDVCQFDARLNLLRLGVAAPALPECAFSREERESLRGR